MIDNQTFNFSNFGDLIGEIWRGGGLFSVGHFMGAFKFAYVDAVFLYAEIFPSILFYTYCFSVMIAKAITKISPFLMLVSSHIKFTNPFKTLFTIAGAFLSALWTLGVFFLGHS